MNIPSPSTFSPARRAAALGLPARFGFLGLLGFLGLAGLLGCGAPQAAAPAAEEESALPVVARRVASEPVVETLDLAADLLPLKRAVLAAEVAGTVEALLVEEGQRVAAGQVLARIDTRALEQAVAEAEALDRQARAQHERAVSLFERRSITKQQLLDAITNRDVAAARLAGTRLELEKSRLRAPWGGQVAERRMEVGDYAVPGQAVVVLLDAHRLKVRSPVPAPDVPYLEVGAPVTVRVEALPDEVFQGEVVRLAAEMEAGSGTLDLEAEIDNPDGRLRPGMFARLEVPRRRIDEALLVPLAALVDLGTEKVVYVLDGEDRARRRAVVPGPVIGERVVVEEGLSAGETVVVEGQHRLGEGQLVARADEAAEGEVTR